MAAEITAIGLTGDLSGIEDRVKAAVHRTALAEFARGYRQGRKETLDLAMEALEEEREAHTSARLLAFVGCAVAGGLAVFALLWWLGWRQPVSVDFAPEAVACHEVGR